MQEQISEQIETNMCSICTERPPSINGCRHRFCLRCIRKWSKKRNTCPLCRQEFLNIRSNGRSYKVDPPKIQARPVHAMSSRPGRIVFMPIIFNVTMNVGGWSSLVVPGGAVWPGPAQGGGEEMNRGVLSFQPVFFFPIQ